MRIVEEHQNGLLYRTVEAEWFDDERNEPEEDELAATARSLASSMARYAEPSRAALWLQIASPAINAEVLSNVFPRVVYTEPGPKQAMLELPSVPGRLKRLVEDLQMMLLAHAVPGQA
ncbi:MAG: Lon protease-like protein [Bradymonadia bacterium]|jgi:Lon protease-like protein